MESVYSAVMIMSFIRIRVQSAKQLFIENKYKMLACPAENWSIESKKYRLINYLIKNVYI